MGRVQHTMGETTLELKPANKAKPGKLQQAPHPILQMQQRIGNQATKRLLQKNTPLKPNQMPLNIIARDTPEKKAKPKLTPAEQARVDAQTILDYIKNTAKQKAKEVKTVPLDAKFYKRLKDHYLKDYLAAPGATTGKAAIDKIGKPFAGPATPGDRWEEGALAHWNKQPIPRAFSALRPLLPQELEAGSDILSIPNRTQLPYIDLPHLVGKPNTNTADTTADVLGGGKNISQLMHWATGVKYSNIDASTMRDFFLAYEMWHLEGWDVFGEDAINDLIAEDAGRILGTKLNAGAVNNANLPLVLTNAFMEARAWVGTLLRARQAELNAWTLSETPKKANMWWGHLTPSYLNWSDKTIYTELLAGKSVDLIKKWEMTQHIIEIYTLVYEADEWEAKNGLITNSAFIQNMLKGEFNSLFEKSVKGQPITTNEVMDAAKKAGN